MTGTSPMQPGPPHSGPVPPPMPPAPTRRQSRAKAWLTHGVTAVVALIIGVEIGSPDAAEDKAGRERPAPTVTTPSRAAETTRAHEPPATEPAPARTTAPSTPSPEPTAKPGPATSFKGDGQYPVGEDIEAATYMTAGPADSLFPNCYWARHKDASGEFSSIVANGNVQGQTRVTVRKGEYLEVKGCLPWKKAG
ncbi:hypothetical protein ACFWJQ_24080 [Streptomyces goshikiensis]|uniref:hypothetical protein n=1 Tax=Streptomyces goshikiensis TaxID=1942 RepID=UPI003647D0AB